MFVLAGYHGLPSASAKTLSPSCGEDHEGVLACKPKQETKLPAHLDLAFYQGHVQQVNNVRD